MLSKAALTTLETLRTGREATPDDLVARTDYSRAHLYRVLDDLRDAGLLVESRGPNNQRRVRAAENAVVEAYRRLAAELDHVDWPALLSPATLRVCWYLDEPRRVTAIADRLGVSRQRVHKVLSPLNDRAMLDPAGPDYALADDLEQLWEFARAVVAHDHRSRVRRLAPSATVEWEDPTHALVRVHDPDDTDALRSADDWRLTGVGKFREYGLEFFLSGEPAFWYAPDEAELAPAEVVCHALVLGADSRRTSYAMLLVESEELSESSVAEVAEKYGLESAVTTLYRALDGEFDPDRSYSDDGFGANASVSLPSEREYSELKSQYDLA